MDGQTFFAEPDRVLSMRCLALLVLLVSCSTVAADPMDRDEAVELLDSIELLLAVETTGELITEFGLKRYTGRVIQISVAGEVLYFEPEKRDAKDLRAFMRDCIDAGRMDPTRTRVVISITKGVIYGDLILPLDVVVELEFETISFAG